MTQINLGITYGEFEGYSARFKPPINLSGEVTLSYFEAVPDEFKRRLGDYIQKVKESGRDVVICWSEDFLDFNKSPIIRGLKKSGEDIFGYFGTEFLNLDKSPIVNFVRGLLEDRVE
jgi:hypothetical protein